MKMQYIVRGLTADGIAMFYSGRAGDGWLTYDPFAAFTYERRESAQHKAKLFNEREPLTGMRFTAFEID